MKKQCKIVSARTLTITRGLLLSIGVAMFFASCVTETVVINEADLTTPVTNPYAISVDDAIAEMYSVMDGLYGIGTRAATREIASVETLNSSQFGAATRADVEVTDLIYVINFKDDAGYAVMAADTRLGESVICVTEKGNISSALLTKLGEGKLTPDDLVVYQEYPPRIWYGWVYDQYGNAAWFDFRPDPNEEDKDGNGYPDGMDIDPDDIPGLGGNPLNNNGDPTYPYSYTSCGDWENYAYGAPLLKTQWDQRAPYNMSCPEDPIVGEESAAGCVAIALAQIIACNEKPAPSDIYSDATFTWAELKAPKYIPDHANPNPSWQLEHEKAQQLSEIIYRIGLGVNMKYSSTVSTARDVNACDYFISLGYSSAELVSDYHEDSIMEMLQNSKPIYFSAQGWSEKDQKDVGHAWVIDGIGTKYRSIIRTTIYLDSNFKVQNNSYEIGKESRELLHCNFGWGGKGNGYYISKLFDSRIPKVDDDNEGNGSVNFDDNYRFILY